MAEFANPDVLVSTEWLESNLDSDDIAIVEVDEDTTAYTKGHIPGAIAINWETELHDLPRRELSPPSSLGSSSATRASAASRRSCSTRATTTGSPPTRTGSFSTAARTT